MMMVMMMIDDDMVMMEMKLSHAVSLNKPKFRF